MLIDLQTLDVVAEVSPTADLVYSLVGLIGGAVFFVGSWRIVSKAGYKGAWSLLLLVPVVNYVMFLVFAFSKWPALARGGDAREAGRAPDVPRPQE